MSRHPADSESANDRGMVSSDRRPKRRLLFLLPFAPRLNATYGAGRAIGQLLAELATRHHVAVLYLRATAEPPLDDILRERCDFVEEVIRPSVDFSVAQRWSRLTSLLRGRPLWATGFWVAAYERRVRVLVKTWRPDVVQIEYHIMGQYLFALDGCPAPRLLTEHDPGVGSARDLWPSHRGFARLIRYLDMLAWARFERAIVGMVQAVVVFTERDQQALAKFAEVTPLIRIPLGTVIPEHPLNPLGWHGTSVLFVGNFIHLPNVDAAARLINSIFPRVQARCPGVTLHIVGDQPPARIRQMANENILITGYVPDVTPYLDRAAIVVAPLRLGGGMRVKVLEALAAGKAVVASPLAVEGLDLVDGEHVVLAENDHQFCEAIVQLLCDPERRTALATRARAWACANLGWDRAIMAYERLYEHLIEKNATHS